MPPTTSEQLAQWMKDNLSETWPWPTANANFADLIVAPLSSAIAGWWARPSGWINSFTSWLTGRATSYGLSNLVALGLDDACALMAQWYEEYCEDTEVPCYADWQEPAQGGG